jgi:predicted DCC family thiol-disulfide oxidoreductase YuxK
LSELSHLVLYDGVCGLCDRFVQFLLRADRHDRLRFAALQGPLGAQILQAHRRSADGLSTVIVVRDYDPHSTSQTLLDRSDAALFALGEMGGFYVVFKALRVVPGFLRNGVYDLIARSRYRIFGRLDACAIPTPATRAKFLDFPKPATTAR